MARPGQSSFRRILLSRILLLSVPVLLIGETVAFRKARSSLLETARQNLKESAVRKGDSIKDAIAALKANLLSASQTGVLQSGSPQEAQQFLNQLAPQLPTHVECLQLRNVTSDNIVASTCGNKPIGYTELPDWWPRSQARSRFNSKLIQIESLWPAQVPFSPPINTTNSQRQLQLLLSAPVYDSTGRLRYALSLQSALQQQERDKPGSLTGSTVVIAQDGTILAHPIFERVGTNIRYGVDSKRLQSIIKNAIAGREDFMHLSFQQDGDELLAGYTAIPNPVTSQPNQKWIILAITRLDNALFGLQEIKIILIVLTIGLLGASLLASLYLARDLARPLEKLRDYALNLHSHHEAAPVPHNFRIREFNQLAEALHHMVERLKAGAEELETAWEEAKNANQLKSEFLATTSHELRNPLNAIINCVRLVRDGYCDDREEEVEFLQRSEEAAIHLLGIINDLLDIAKIEAGKLSVVLEPIDLQQVLKEVMNIQSVSIQHKGLQLKVNDLPETIPVHADPAKLKQVLINVIGNAAKFTERGSITITTKTQPLVSDLNGNGSGKFEVVVTVQDTGVGIDPAQQHKLFRPFVMVDGTTTRKFGGTGLGLAISRNLMEMMAGTITLYSAGINRGTTVKITMPVMNASPLRSSEEKVEEMS